MDARVLWGCSELALFIRVLVMIVVEPVIDTSKKHLPYIAVSWSGVDNISRLQ